MTPAPTYTQLVSWDNLLLAYRDAARGKRGHPEVAAFEHRLEDHLVLLREELTSRTYRPAPHTTFFVHEPKRRLISAAPFRDRVVHHALCNVIEPGFERAFVSSSYANRRGKGTHRALDCAQRLARRFAYVLQCDVRQFLRAVLARKITDPDILGLVDLILDERRGTGGEAQETAYFPDDDLFAALRPRGLPIGNLTSQFWANVYLSPFDHFVTRELRCRGYVRYVDDFLLFGDDKNLLWTWRQALVGRLGRLRLTIHPGAQPRPVREGIPFLGFVIFPARRRLKRRKAVHFQRKLRHLVEECRAGTLPVARLTASLVAWINHAPRQHDRPA